MPELNITLPDDEWAALADAQGRSVEDLALHALRRHACTEQSLVRHQGTQLALRHASLLRRLGE
ncbi:hypothetical protein [Streptomyces sp. NPDC002889]|uniref:hypothetical protein n=1 Tax=Streptomyces sp. NPDC002889 TaxID=3364669 RepID=UPI0036A1170E